MGIPTLFGGYHFTVDAGELAASRLQVQICMVFNLMLSKTVKLIAVNVPGQHGFG